MAMITPMIKPVINPMTDVSPAAATAQAAAAAKLQAAFEALHRDRMQDVPILNGRLRVACIGMRGCDDGWLAALVTPWFINLMLLPASAEAAEAWRGIDIGGKSLHQFPAGRFEFIMGELADIGRYRMCSLFSPVLEFEDQAAAELTAAAALDALFDAEHGDNADARASGAIAAEQAAVVAPAATAGTPSRRGLLFGPASVRGGRS